jgi:hypothetical protein
VIVLPVFTTAPAFFGLLAVPAIVAIYYLHMRARVLPVSSLLLWADVRFAPEGGRRVERLRFPLLFWLELLLIILLCLAAAGPHLPAGTTARPLIVVLDDSFSMRAGGAVSPRARAAEALQEELRNRPRGTVRFVLAGEQPQLLADAPLGEQLERWTCDASTARLDSAIAFGFQIGGDQAAVLVLTDHAADPPPASGRLRWWSFGTSRPNWAIVNASRTPGPRGDRLLIEVANLAKEARSTPLRIEADGKELRRIDVRLNAGEVHRAVLELPPGQGAVKALVEDEELPSDNVVTLLSAIRRTIRYDVRLGDPKLHTAVEKALEATDAAIPEAKPHLVFLDAAAEAPADESAWVVRVLAEPDAEAFTGPFVIDRAHPLADGLSLAGAVWGGGKTPLPGAPVVMVGNTPLVTDSESPGGRHELRLRLRHDLSTLLESPAWPVLLVNLVQWRAAHLPGLNRTNVRIGEEVVWTLAADAEAIHLTRPNGSAVNVPVHNRRAAIRAEQAGVNRLEANGEAASFAAFPLNRDESDLTKATTGKWGEELDDSTLRFEYRDLRWALLLTAAVIATLHLWAAARSRGAA